ncbi:hypothetical protein CCR75_000163 [Bremia lactucae]|uniref:Ras-related protein Rab n=1 Tax=Bremia lactucae TaxID=4779 RepID=A0A976IFN4_BRELC|nr:hypothetical protein CCR75_000163 [Bremia lactucae]
MDECTDITAMFSEHSARIIQQHRSSNTSIASHAPDLIIVKESKDYSSSLMTTRHPIEATDLLQSGSAARSRHEVKQPLAAVANSPGSTSDEEDEMLAQYSSDSESSGSEDDEHETIILKVLIVGNARCGKTSTIRRFTKNEFKEEYVSTIGADFVEKIIRYDANLTISLQLWDIAGQDRFAKFTRGYFREARGAVIVCDITRTNTIDAVVKWKHEIDTCCKDLKHETAIPVVMIANKSDLLMDPIKALDIGVNMQKCVEKNKIVEWFRASAKSGERIPEAFQCLIDRMVDTYRIEKESTRNNDSSSSVKGSEQATPGVIHLTEAPPHYRAIKQKKFACDCT